MVSEDDYLLEHRHKNTEGSSDESYYPVVQEYPSLAVAVFENEEHRPIVMHDLYGPVMHEEGTLERQDSIVSTISQVLQHEEHPDILEYPEHDDIDAGGKATVPSEIASMAKNIIGCGVLSLSGGIARCANAPSAIWAANFWIMALGIIFGYFCYLIAKVCKMTGRTTYRGIWQKTMGHKGSMAISISNALKAAMAELAYASILADTIVSLLRGIGWEVPRVFCLLLVTIVGILPLCMLKDLHVLAPFSILGTAGIVLTAIAMTIRYVDGSYLPGGQFHKDLQHFKHPSFGTYDESWSTGILPFVCMTYEAYVMHYNSARFYTELKNRSLPRFAVAVGSSFGISALLYMAIASMGYLTFGANSSSFILNSYSSYDPLATLSRIAVGLSTLTAYPIVFIGVRDGVMDTFAVPITEQTPERVNRLTYILLSILTITAMFISDLGLINAVGGGLVATAIVFVFPTIMFRAAVHEKGTAKENRNEMVLASVLTLMGVVIGLVGVYRAIAGSFG